MVAMAAPILDGAWSFRQHSHPGTLHLCRSSAIKPSDAGYLNDVTDRKLRAARPGLLGHSIVQVSGLPGYSPYYSQQAACITYVLLAAKISAFLVCAHDVQYRNIRRKCYNVYSISTSTVQCHWSLILLYV